PVTRAYLEARAAHDPLELAQAERVLAGSTGTLAPEALAQVEARPELSAILRTTCVATMLAGGTRVNSLPAEASAQINCRILPGETVDDVARTLTDVFADPALEMRASIEFGAGDPSPIGGPTPAAVARVTAAMWPQATVVPTLMPGATDSRFLRAHGIAAYGLSPIPISDDDARRAHGIDERIPADGLRTGVEFFYRLLCELAGTAPGA